MVSAKLIPRTEYRRATWKNGLGHTDEIAIHPPGADLRRGDFLFRLSSARIEQASPFSPFPDHDRVLVVLRGRGVRLTHAFPESGDEESVELPPLQPYDFPGDVPSRCELLAGPITDLSVFVRKAEAEAITDVREIPEGESYEWVPVGRWNFAFVAQGGISASSAHHETLSASEGDTLRLELDSPLSEDAPIALRASAGGARVVLVGIQG